MTAVPAPPGAIPVIWLELLRGYTSSVSTASAFEINIGKPTGQSGSFTPDPAGVDVMEAENDVSCKAFAIVDPVAVKPLAVAKVGAAEVVKVAICSATFAGTPRPIRFESSAIVYP